MERGLRILMETRATNERWHSGRRDPKSCHGTDLSAREGALRGHLHCQTKDFRVQTLYNVIGLTQDYALSNSALEAFYKYRSARISGMERCVSINRSSTSLGLASIEVTYNRLILFVRLFREIQTKDPRATLIERRHSSTWRSWNRTSAHDGPEAGLMSLQRLLLQDAISGDAREACRCRMCCVCSGISDSEEGCPGQRALPGSVRGYKRRPRCLLISGS